MKNDNSNVDISKSPLHRLIILKAMLKALRFSVRRSDVDPDLLGNFPPFDASVSRISSPSAQPTISRNASWNKR
jgi:hypothetical protein